MLGRITPLMTSATILADLNKAQAQMDTTQQQMASGKTINQPSDNPYGASLAVSLNSDLASLSGYSNQITDGTGWAQAADSSMTNIGSMLQRAQELVVQAANGTNSAADQSATAAEITQIIDAVKQEGNAQFNGQYIFAGNATSTAPYSTATGDAYQGNAGTGVYRSIGPGSSLQVNADVSSLLNGSALNPPNGVATSGLLGTLRQVVTDLNANSSTGLSSDLTSLQGNLQTLGGLQANMGATQDRLTLATSRITSLQNSDTASLSNVQDVNMASAMTTFSSEQAAFSAALQAGGKIVQESLMNFLN
jgi:flagellar hook-associated protein 3 FlgL